jgi:hypothetical protein
MIFLEWWWFLRFFPGRFNFKWLLIIFWSFVWWGLITQVWDCQLGRFKSNKYLQLDCVLFWSSGILLHHSTAVGGRVSVLLIFVLKRWDSASSSPQRPWTQCSWSSQTFSSNLLGRFPTSGAPGKIRPHKSRQSFELRLAAPEQRLV